MAMKVKSSVSKFPLNDFEGLNDDGKNQRSEEGDDGNVHSL